MKPHSRLPRGAIEKYASSLNSAISNLKNGNISHFNMKFRSKRSPTDYLSFEDKGYPAFLNNIKSVYWYKSRENKRVNIPLSKINKTSVKRGMEIIYEKKTNKYFLHYPVSRDWFPEDDKRNDSQIKFRKSGDRIISLDPGIRKFLVGYDPTGKSIFIGEGANTELINLLHVIDKTEDSYLLWKKVKNLVAEMHWKSISYLIENYDIILLPEFKVSQMIKKKNKLSRNTKRLMNMYSFYKFRERLQYKCNMYNKKLIIVDESYTSCTCGQCGKINQVKGNEVFECKHCGLVMDRDAGGSRNILIKNISLKNKNK
jgi:IS605 OrfB family transposase